jgi:Heparinase II/III-like protein
MTLSLAGRPLLVDPGTATYTVDSRLRDRFRSSVSHNTLTIDNQSQACPSGPFRWLTRANATLHGWRTHPRIDWAEGSHDAYAPIRHRRSVVRTADSGWLVVDQVLGSGVHTAAAHWHVDPCWTLRLEALACVHASHSDGGEAWMIFDAGDLFLAHGDEASGLGWYAPAYGVMVPSWTARVTRTSDAPFAMITWIGTTAAGSRQPPSIERLFPVRAAADAVVAARVNAGERSSVFVICPHDQPLHRRQPCETGGYHTDGRVLHCVEDHGTVKRLDLIDAMHAVTPRGGGITITASEAMADLHVSIEDGILDLQASQPPAHLRIQSGAIEHIVSLRLNHRELPAATDHSDTVFVYGVDWSVPLPALLNSLV